jgi:hypothetical protein
MGDFKRKMMIIYSQDNGPIIYPKDILHDPNSNKFYRIDWKPPVRESSRAYIKDLDVVIPPVNNGCMYECISGGITASTDIVFDTIEGRSTIDGDVKWRCIPYTSKIAYTDTIIESSWVADDPEIILTNNVILNASATYIRVDYVPATKKYFIITNTVKVLRSSGLEERFDKSIKVGVLQL